VLFHPEVSKTGVADMSDDDIRNLLDDTLKLARNLGADDVAVAYTRGEKLKVSVLEKESHVERSTGNTIGVDVYVGKRMASTTISTQKPEDIREAVEEVVAAAKTMPENEYAGLADPSEIARSWPDLDLYDATRPDVEELLSQARDAEGMARLQPMVVKSQGAEAQWSESKTIVMATNGFRAMSLQSSSHIAVGVIASDGKNSESEGDYTQARHRSDLRSALDVGEKGGSKAARILGAREPKTGKYPVVFHPDIAASLLAEFAKAVMGPTVVAKDTFLRNQMGKQIFASGITIKDDPHLRRGPGSRGFDGEGIPTRPLTVVENGVLKSWFLDLESARELGLKSTGHASGITNLFIEAGKASPAELIADIEEGFYVMGLMGHGANTLTGDFSQGASGLWIKNGELAYPVAGATVAGTLQDMFLNVIPANDLNVMQSDIAAPTLRFPSLTVSGE
jgi:PmbA protein